MLTAKQRLLYELNMCYKAGLTRGQHTPSAINHTFHINVVILPCGKMKCLIRAAYVPLKSLVSDGKCCQVEYPTLLWCVFCVVSTINDANHPSMSTLCVCICVQTAISTLS